MAKNQKNFSAKAEEREEMVKVITLIKTVAQMRDAYAFKDEEGFIKIEPDPLSRKPRIEIKFIDDEKDLEITMARVVRE